MKFDPALNGLIDLLAEATLRELEKEALPPDEGDKAMSLQFRRQDSDANHTRLPPRPR